MTSSGSTPRSAPATPVTPAASAFLAAYDAVLAEWPTPVETRELPTAFGRTHVNVTGAPEGPPLVLLHGGQATAAAWYANVADLGRTHRLYAVDRFGEAGRSTVGDQPPRTTAELHGWLTEVLDGLGLDRPALLGHSYGGWIALGYAVRHPERVGRLVLLDPTQCFAGFRPGYLLRALPLLARPTAARALALADWETGARLGTPAWRTLQGLAAVQPGRRIVTGPRPRTDRLRTPTLALFAERSRTHHSPRLVARLQAHPTLRAELLPGLSHHALPFTGTPELNRRIVTFLTEQAEQTEQAGQAEQ
ncbi:carboxylesterase [Kitasatospora sp. MMS16-BH015]|uniref:alpha/beta fold hydrolase n=1 Tax=Kitasatospora sp. MMS16-BH015 TaxID=2018025 RepID=UPI000CA2246D|nr:alpha/beta hydrolase [Kitasatospora sp. MMS16-BH015]AUG80842.1 carboxylesterase [Kitasatospora sp. MMS16-BH015]